MHALYGDGYDHTYHVHASADRVGLFQQAYLCARALSIDSTLWTSTHTFSKNTTYECMSCGVLSGAAQQVGCKTTSSSNPLRTPPPISPPILLLPALCWRLVLEDGVLLVACSVGACSQIGWPCGGDESLIAAMLGERAAHSTALICTHHTQQYVPANRLLP